MLKRIALLVISGVIAFGYAEQSMAETIKMSTTTSTQDSGLLEVLLPVFTNATGIEVQVLAKGTGAALRDGQDGNVDVVFVHDPERENKFVADGFGTKRYAVMHNDFVLVGPAGDPVEVKKTTSAAGAFKRIAEKSAIFISRGDESGTHAKELYVWKQSGVELVNESKTVTKKAEKTQVTFEVPKGAWYLSIGQGMGKTLIMADEKQAYALTDRGTFIQMKYGASKPVELDVVFEGDKELFNPYGVIPVNPEKFPHVKYKAAVTFAEWLVSDIGQKVIANYRLQGKQVFYPDALPDVK